MCRTPSRHYKQGSDSKNTMILGLDEPLFLQEVNQSCVVNMIKDIYPSPQDALEFILCGQKTSVAISREFAVSKGEDHLFDILYKSLCVGSLDTNTGAITPEKGFEVFVKNFGVLWNGR